MGGEKRSRGGAKDEGPFAMSPSVPNTNVIILIEGGSPKWTRHNDRHDRRHFRPSRTLWNEKSDFRRAEDDRRREAEEMKRAVREALGRAKPHIDAAIAAGRFILKAA
jgi:hypothetical protein